MLLRSEHITIRAFRFFLKDLFLAEGAEPTDDDEAVQIDLLEFDAFDEEPGVTIWAFLLGFFVKKAVPLVLQRTGSLLGATVQITKATASNVPYLLPLSSISGFWGQVVKGQDLDVTLDDRSS